MIYKSNRGVYVFGFDDLADTSSKWDHLFGDLEGALEFCKDKYVQDDKWIDIEDPYVRCQDDWIERVRVKEREEAKSEWEQFEQLSQGHWRRISKSEKVNTFEGMTGNERLFTSGLLREFENSLKCDKLNAEKILRALQWDESSLKKILQ